MFVDWATAGGKPGNFALRGTLPLVQGCIHLPSCESLMEGLLQIFGKWEYPRRSDLHHSVCQQATTYPAFIGLFAAELINTR